MKLDLGFGYAKLPLGLEYAFTENHGAVENAAAALHTERFNIPRKVVALP